MGKNPRLNNRIMSIFALLLVVAMLIGLISRCDSWGGIVSEDPSQDLPFVNPSEQGTANSTKVKLYFRCTDEAYLSGDTRSVEVRADERTEAAVLRELIKGPSSSKPELEALIHPQTRVIDVTDSGDTLIVTISGEFLQQAKPLPENWTDDLVLREEAMLRRRLAVYSVVDTLTGMGRYAKVQILVDLDGSGIGKRVRSATFGFTSGGVSETPLEPKSFESKVILNPSNTLDLILRSVIEKNWSSVYRFISQREEYGTVPVYENALSMFATLPAQIDRYSIVESIIETSGDKAVVFIDIRYHTKNGEVFTRKSVPIRMLMENEIWKATYESVARMLSVPQ